MLNYIDLIDWLQEGKPANVWVTVHRHQPVSTCNIFELVDSCITAMLHYADGKAVDTEYILNSSNLDTFDIYGIQAINYKSHNCIVFMTHDVVDGKIVPVVKVGITFKLQP